MVDALHVDELEAWALVRAELDASAAQRVRAHVLQCEDCRELVAAVARAVLPGDDRGSAPAGLHEGARCGRYRLLAPLGRGGMGEVWSAWDPQLGRRVAIKTVHAELSAHADHVLGREAEALARLSHPNVVTVLEILRTGDSIALVMEWVDGDTLARWQRSPARTSDEILDAYVEAARGLAAAHAAGVVHRDFKPQNVIVGRDGRARVLDFGLATVTPDAISGLRTREQGRTMSGGTPGFMAPEVIEGGCGDARADQFSFCVALWEALGRSRPFVDEAAGSSGEPRLRGPLRSIPAAIAKVLRRGLHPDPAARFMDIDALVVSLERARRGAGVRRGAALIAVGVLVGIGIWRVPWPVPPSLCDEIHRQMRATWNADVEQDIAAAIGTDQAVAADVRRELDAWATAWRTELERTCSGEPAAMQAQAVCLDGHRRAFADVVERIRRADASWSDRLVDVALDVPHPRRCRRDPTTATDSHAIHLRHRIRQTEAEIGVALDAGTHARANALLEQARATGDASLTAHAGVVYGLVLREDGRLGEAIAVLEAAYLEAAAVADMDSMAQAAKGIAWSSVKQGHHAEALEWLRHMEAATDPEDRGALAEAASQRAAVFRERGALADAHAELDRGLELAPADHPVRVLLLDERVRIHFDEGRGDDALRAATEQLAFTEAYFGPEHPNVLAALESIGVLASASGRFAEAHAAFARALRIVEVRRPGNEIAAAMVRANHSLVFDAMGDYRTARELLQRARIAMEPSVGADSIELARMMDDEARYAARVASWAEALALADRAIAIHGDAHVPCTLLQTRAVALAGLERIDEALVAWAHASECGDGEDRGRAHHGRAKLFARLGRWDEAGRAVELARIHYADSSITNDGVKGDLELACARIAIARGRHDEARAAIEAARRLLARPVDAVQLANRIAVETVGAELGS